MTTIGSALRWAIDELRFTSDSARVDAHRLLEHVVGRGSASIIANDQEPLAESDHSQFVNAIERRRGGEPVAYIVGRSGFFGDTYKITDDVAVPRPESEHLVECALDFLRPRLSNEAAQIKVLDVGTGSGAIACAIAGALPEIRVDATDISAAAIAVARKNAARLGVTLQCRFFVGDLAAPVKGQRYSCIIANLPYIPTAQLPSRPDPVSYEPRNALDGGVDGLAVYRRLMPQTRELLAPDALLLLEGAPPMIESLVALAQAHFPQARVSVPGDYAHIDRLIAISTGGATSCAE